MTARTSSRDTTAESHMPEPGVRWASSTRWSRGGRRADRAGALLKMWLLVDVFDDVRHHGGEAVDDLPPDESPPQPGERAGEPQPMSEAAGALVQRLELVLEVHDGAREPGHAVEARGRVHPGDCDPRSRPASRLDRPRGPDRYWTVKVRLGGVRVVLRPSPQVGPARPDLLGRHVALHHVLSAPYTGSCRPSGRQLVGNVDDRFYGRLRGTGRSTSRSTILQWDVRSRNAVVSRPRRHCSMWEATRLGSSWVTDTRDNSRDALTT